MKKESYEGDVQILVSQNRNLWLTIAALVVGLILVLMVAWNGMGANRTIVVPPKLDKSFWITDQTAAGEYIEQMAQWVSYLTLDVTPENVDYKSDILLKLADPDYNGALKQKLRINAQKIKRDNAATSFDVRVVKNAPDILASILTGYLKVTINGTVVKSEMRHYLAQFNLKGGQAHLVKFQQVKNDDFKSALTEIDPDENGNTN